MIDEEIVRRWQPEAHSQLQQWIDRLAMLGTRSDQLLTARGDLLTAHHAAAGRQMLARFKADPAAIAEADAYFTQIDNELGQINAELVTLRAQETALEIQIYQADEYLQGIMARFEQALTTVATSGQLSERIDEEFVAHAPRVRQLLRAADDQVGTTDAPTGHPRLTTDDHQSSPSGRPFIRHFPGHTSTMVPRAVQHVTDAES